MENGITTEDFVIPSNATIKELADFLYGQITEMSFFDIILCIQAFHNTPRYSKNETAIKFVDYIIKNISMSPDVIFTLRWLLPVQSSILRALKRQKEAIELFEKECARIANNEPLILPGINLKEAEKFNLITNHWILSISAAYLDLDDRKSAERVLKMGDFSEEDRRNDLFKSLMDRFLRDKKQAVKVIY